ncbi:MAG: acyltransferase [Gluconacetobacter diazotrophicus]|nr:acyltransferase [Gluconacetobacter diazotrophicus]
MPNRTKIIFANQLRGIAAISVLVTHYAFVAQMVRPMVGWVVAAPELSGPISPVATWVQALPVDPSATGVGLFFLLSGFVIPYSLDRTGPLPFLLARAARIFPTFWAALLLEWSAVCLSGHYWHRSSPFGWADYLCNGSLLNILLGRPSVDWVSWTLSIEVKFYLAAALLKGPMRRHPAFCTLALSALALALNVVAARGSVSMPPRLAGESTCVAFILIGWLFHAHLVGRLGARSFLAATVATMALVLLCWKLGPLASEFAGRSRSFIAALLIFSVCYRLRDRFRSSALLDGAAAISYPLYLLHAVVGFAIMTFLTNALGIPYLGSASAALVICIALAVGLHVLIEKPSIRLGHRIASGWRRRSPGAILVAPIGGVASPGR